MNPEYYGNTEILSLHKIGFICSRSTSSRAILPCLDWATQHSGNNSTAIVSTFHSSLEQSVLKILTIGTCPIIVVVARAPYKALPEVYKPFFDSGRLLMAYISSQHRITRESAAAANRHIADISQQTVFGYIDSAGSLAALYAQLQAQGKEIEVLS